MRGPRWRAHHWPCMVGTSPDAFASGGFAHPTQATNSLPGENLLGVDRVLRWQACRLQRRRGRIPWPAPPRQFCLDAPRYRLAEYAAKIERPEAVGHGFDGDAAKRKTFAVSGCQIIRPDHAHAGGI